MCIRDSCSFSMGSTSDVKRTWYWPYSLRSRIICLRETFCKRAIGSTCVESYSFGEKRGKKKNVFFLRKLLTVDGLFVRPVVGRDIIAPALGPQVKIRAIVRHPLSSLVHGGQSVWYKVCDIRVTLVRRYCKRHSSWLGCSKPWASSFVGVLY